MCNKDDVIDAAIRYRFHTKWLKLVSAEGRKAMEDLDAALENETINDGEYLINKTVSQLKDILNMAKELGITNTVPIWDVIKLLEDDDDYLR